MDATHSHTLLPAPKLIRLGHERVSLGSPEVQIQSADLRIASEWERLRARLVHTVQSGRAIGAKVVIAESTSSAAHPDGYQLRVSRNGVELVGGSPAGCFYGLKTLEQLIDPRTGEFPCGEIRDQPDYATRGLLHDVTRGKSPKLETLKQLVDRLSAWKINQLQLYIEHSFVFTFDPEICGPDEGLTPDEVRELDRYCRERFIDLVPAVATLGHMGRVLALPRYRPLAEIEAARPWNEMSWLERMRGFTLDVLNPQSRELVSRIWSDILDAFSSPIVNICGDEPWDLGRGKNADRLDAHARGEAYVDHILWTHDLCAARGRRTQLWSDVVRNHPHLLPRLPCELTVLHWGYDDRADYAGTRIFSQTGLSTFVCPGTSGWKRIINSIHQAERNIQAFARAGREHGADGLINTDWGDFGHFNALACSWHGIALGAALAWNSEQLGGPDFDRRLAERLLGIPVEAVFALRQASLIAEQFDTWRLMALPDALLRDEKRMPSMSDCAQAADAAVGCRRWLESSGPPSYPAGAEDHRELILACEFTEIFAQRMQRLLQHGDSMHGRERADHWSNRLPDAVSRYAKIWLQRNKPLRLRDITDRLPTSG